MGKISKDSTKTIIIRGNNDKCEHIKILINSIGTLLVNQSCPTLCDPMTPLSMEISQARILEWAATSSSRGFSRPKDGTQVSPIAGRFFTIGAPGKPYGNKSTPKKVNHGQVGGNIIRCFTKFQFPTFFFLKT